MRYAIISDIHANLEALTAALSAARGLGADRVICLGDIVGFNADPNECVSLIRQQGIPCVRGNHDSVAAGLAEPDDFVDSAKHAIFWTRTVLHPDHVQWLAALPLVLNIDQRFTIVHASLHPQPNDDERIRTCDDALPTLERIPTARSKTRLCFAGHTHHRAVYQLTGNSVCETDTDVVQLAAGDAYLINPGSIGQPRDSDPRASMALYDEQAATVSFHRVPYDRAVTLRKSRSAGLIPRPHLLRRSASWLKHRVRETLHQ